MSAGNLFSRIYMKSGLATGVRAPASESPNRRAIREMPARRRTIVPRRRHNPRQV
ncbi:hypothetical protein PATSB16_38650 [Pandoraea thiooxydans]|nr:hypothetical protein PATSB16_38650 [Pandoraea thiooxydans]